MLVDTFPPDRDRLLERLLRLVPFPHPGERLPGEEVVVRQVDREREEPGSIASIFRTISRASASRSRASAGRPLSIKYVASSLRPKIRLFPTDVTAGLALAVVLQIATARRSAATASSSRPRSD